jgi:cytochrome c553
MKSLVFAACVAVVTFPLAGLAAETGADPAPQLQQPIWAYAVRLEPQVPRAPDDGKPRQLEGADRAFTLGQIAGRYGANTPEGPADWFPQSHPAMPLVVAQGPDPQPGVASHACSLCHFPNGKGRPENASVAGLPRAYIVRQLHEMKAGRRNSAEPLKTNAKLMGDIAKSLSEAQISAAATYFSSMRWTPWIRVVESTTAPKVESEGGLYIPLTGAEAGLEPLDGRIVEVSEDPDRAALRDPRVGWVAYVPVGSVARGRRMVATGGGKTLPCAACHGQDLGGVGMVPGIAGRSPSYLARQLNDFKQGTRRGQGALLMRPVARKLTPKDITDIVAYVSSRPVPARPARRADAGRSSKAVSPG